MKFILNSRSILDRSVPKSNGNFVFHWGLGSIFTLRNAVTTMSTYHNREENRIPTEKNACRIEHTFHSCLVPFLYREKSAAAPQNKYHHNCTYDRRHSTNEINDELSQVYPPPHMNSCMRFRIPRDFNCLCIYSIECSLYVPVAITLIVQHIIDILQSSPSQKRRLLSQSVSYDHHAGMGGGARARHRSEVSGDYYCYQASSRPH